MRYRILTNLAILGCVVVACGHGAGKMQGLLTEGRPDEALRDADKCLAETPGRVECLTARAQALDMLGRGGEAAEAWFTVVQVDHSHDTAWERLVAYVDAIPAPSFGVELLGAIPQPAWRVPSDRLQHWAAQASRGDSIVAAASTLSTAAEWADAVETLRSAVRTDGGRVEIRRALCDALLNGAVRGESFSERTGPLREVVAICSQQALMPSVRGELEESAARAVALLEHERGSLAAAKTYQPWPGARFDVSVDTLSYYPRIQFRCDETKYADITIDFSAQDPQHTLVGERISLLQYPKTGSPSVGTLKGAPSVIVLAELGDYRLVSVGGLKGWVLSGSLAEKHRFTAEIKPRGSMELRVRPAMAHVRVDVDGMNVFRGDVELKPYVVYRWSF